MAPEVSKCSGSLDAGYTFVADIWSVGCVVIGKQKTRQITK